MGVDVIQISKDKVIEETKLFLNEMFRGHYDYNYQHILALITYIQSYHHLDNEASFFEKLMEHGIDIQ